MKKGFTMIELLAVFTITGIILLMAMPEITSLLKKSNNDKYETFKNNLYIACEAYIEGENIEITNEKEISLKTLIDNGYLKSTTINPKNDSKVSDSINKNKKIIVTKDENNILKYKFNE